MSDLRATADGPPRARGRRAVARRNRTAVIEATAQLLRGRDSLTMQAVAAAAGVGRSTLYRHFANPRDLQLAVQQETLARAAIAIRKAVSSQRSALAQLKYAVSALVDVGAELPLDVPLGPPSDEAVADAGHALAPLTERLARAAGVAPAPAAPWLAAGIAHFVATCLRGGWSDPDAARQTAERLFSTVTDPLYRGLLLLDATGTVVASNPHGRITIDAAEPGRRVVVHNGGLYEDGSVASPEVHPISAALAGGEAQRGIRGHYGTDGGDAAVVVLAANATA